MFAEALVCLALNIYHEARDQPFIGQVAVAQVVMNNPDYGSQKCCEAYGFLYEPDKVLGTFVCRPRLVTSQPTP